MFFFKRKKIVLDAFTYDVSYYEHARPEKAVKFFPDWWKEVPNTVTDKTQNGLEIDRSTIRACSGFVDLYKNSVILPLWSDLVIETQASGMYTYQYADERSPNIVTHGSGQYGHKLPDLIHVKLETPWRFREKSGIYFACIEPTWNYLNRNVTMNILPGIVQYNINSTTSVNMFLPKDHQRLEFNYGDPIYNFIPLTEHKVEIKHHLLDEKEFLKYNDWSVHRFKFRNNYKLRKNMTTKCPFNF